MSINEEKSISRLKRIQDGGFIRFVLIGGVCSWGIPFALITITLFFMGFGLPEGYVFSKEANIKIVAFIFAISVIGGAIWGMAMWRYNMKLLAKVNKYQSQK